MRIERLEPRTVLTSYVSDLFPGRDDVDLVGEVADTLYFLTGVSDGTSWWWGSEELQFWSMHPDDESPVEIELPYDGADIRVISEFRFDDQLHFQIQLHRSSVEKLSTNENTRWKTHGRTVSPSTFVDWTLADAVRVPTWVHGRIPATQVPLTQERIELEDAYVFADRNRLLLSRTDNISNAVELLDSLRSAGQIDGEFYFTAYSSNSLFRFDEDTGIEAVASGTHAKVGYYIANDTVYVARRGELLAELNASTNLETKIPNSRNVSAVGEFHQTSIGLLHHSFEYIVRVDETDEVFAAANSFDFADFLELSESFGKQVDRSDSSDLNGDGFVDFADFLILSARFGA